MPARTIGDMAGNEDIQPAYLAQVLHAPQPPEVYDRVNEKIIFSIMIDGLFVLWSKGIQAARGVCLIMDIWLRRS
jgi:hypothetical protein